VTTRAERAAEAARLKSAGLSWQEACERMGVSRSYYFELLNDPDGSVVRARKGSYRGVCAECGGPTDGSNGRGRKAPKLCANCVTYWTPERVIAAIQAWAERYGEPPRYLEWGKVGPDRSHPANTTAAGPFGGSFAAAIEAAGLEPHRRRDAHRFDGADWDAICARIRSGEDVDDIALEFGSTGPTLRWALRWRGYSMKAIREGAVG
jgi:hypothetical protein